MSKKEVKLKGVMNRDQVAAYLEEMIAGFKAGRICVQQGEHFVALCPEQLINVKIQASAKKDKEKFEMELAWRKEEASGEISDMHTSASGPETPPETPEGAAQELPAVSGPAIEVQASETPGPAAEAPKTAGEAPKTCWEAPKTCGEAPKTGREAGEAGGEAGEASGIKGKKGKEYR